MGFADGEFFFCKMTKTTENSAENTKQLKGHILLSHESQYL